MDHIENLILLFPFLGIGHHTPTLREDLGHFAYKSAHGKTYLGHVNLLPRSLDYNATCSIIV